METRNIIINKLGTLMMANAELAAENARIVTEHRELQGHIAMLKAELARWQETAREKEELRAAEAERAAAAEATRAVGEDLPANPYSGEVKH